MAEARAKFKEENPEYKSSYKSVRVQKEVFPEVPHNAGKLVGLLQAELFNIVQEKFPTVTVYGLENTSKELLEAIPADMPLDLQVSKKDYLPLIQFLKEDPRTLLNFLIDVTAVDWVDHFDVVAQLMSLEKGHKVFFRLSLNKDDSIAEEKKATSILASAPSLCALYAGAEWKEREVYDMFGINFENHPDLRRIFLDKDFVGYPLRKDFTHPHIIRRG